MKQVFFILLFILVTTQNAAFAQDNRMTARQAARKQAELIEKAQAEQDAARKEAEQSRRRIFSDRAALTAALAELQKRHQTLQIRNKKLSSQLSELSSREEALRSQLTRSRETHRDLEGFFRTAARDLLTLVSQSYQTALAPQRYRQAEQLAGKEAVPSMAHIRALEDMLIEEIDRSGEVRLVKESPFISRTGEQLSGALLLLGNFTAVYHRSPETGFLIFSDKSRRFFALSRPPERRWLKKINAYMEGRSEDVLIDISRGAALRQYTQRPRLADQIRRGGPIVWPIMLIGVLGFLIIIERTVSLQRKHMDSDRFMTRVSQLAAESQWEKCRSLCRRYPHKVLPRVLTAGIEFCRAPREDLENVLQEAILNEIPSIERFLSTLGMLAVIAPLLGLLGTVTGMINTFQAITFFGTGNPRVMSGGISEALITTMLGLAVAIPILLAHSLLSRKVEKLIGDLEARAVAFINQVCKGEKISP